MIICSSFLFSLFFYFSKVLFISLLILPPSSVAHLSHSSTAPTALSANLLILCALLICIAFPLCIAAHPPPSVASWFV